MILVDTSIWIEHLRSGDTRLADLLDRSQVLAHRFVTGELACGNLRNRDEILKLLNDLPQSPVASPTEALNFIERHQLMGLGIGYIDIHLLAATALAENATLWTGDRRLKKIARKMKLAVDE
jgi:predicted nucleic acid-binding protein